MRKLLVISGIAACAASANAIVIIDNFTSGGFSDSINTVGSKVTVSQLGAMLGGERDVRLEIVATGGFSQSLRFEVGAGFSVSSSGSGVNGMTELQYDVVGDETAGSPNFSPTYGTGLGVNLAPENAFRVRFLFNDLLLNLKVTVDKIGTGTWVGTTAVAGGISSPTDVYISFASMAGPGAYTGLSDRITFSFDTSAAGDFAIGELAAVPEPATMTALALALGGLVARRRRK